MYLKFLKNLGFDIIIMSIKINEIINMKTKLTSERTAIRNAQANKWYLGDRGGAISYPYRVKRYLSKELSDKVATKLS